MNKPRSVIQRYLFKFISRPGGGTKLVLPLFVVLLISAASLLALYIYFTGLLEPVSKPEEAANKVIVVRRGASTGEIGNLLADEELVRSRTAFRLYAKIKQMDGRMQAGEYEISNSLSIPQITAIFVKGQTTTINFTIPEGFNLKQIGDRLEEKGFIDRQKFNDLIAQGVFDYEFIQNLPKGPARLEGYLFPDTYTITKDVTEEQIIDMMLARFAAEITPEFTADAEQLGMTVHQAVTLASIIEREAQKDEERPKVAAVFLNRLKKGWKLQSCATVQYILGEPKARLLDKDLQIKSPYNTYLNSGLPPGPIAAAGRASLRAAVEPADVDYLFFVVAGDGKHIFSRTLAEHNRAAAAYQSSLK